MNEYSFEIKKKYGGEHPSYSGILTCNGSEYSMILSADEEKRIQRDDSGHCGNAEGVFAAGQPLCPYLSG